VEDGFSWPICHWPSRSLGTPRAVERSALTLTPPASRSLALPGGWMRVQMRI
ncbi:unnamed protein product, partial [Effrenium voratum]